MIANNYNTTDYVQAIKGMDDESSKEVQKFIVKEDGKEIGRSVNDRTLTPGTLDSSDNLVDTDLSGEPAEVSAICTAAWTTSVKDAWKAKLIAE